MEYYPGPGRNQLFVPGPVNVPEQVLRAMNRNNEDYRSPAMPTLSKSVLEDVKRIFKTTTATSFIFPTTGNQSMAFLSVFALIPLSVGLVLGLLFLHCNSLCVWS